MNTPNKLTILRVVLVPVFLVFMLAIPKNTAYITATLVVFVVAAITDSLDGYLARKNGLVTNFGKLMDPLADKVLTTVAYLGLLSMDRASVWAIMLILAREYTVSGVRLVAAANGTVIAASMWGKVKTVFQMISIIVAILLMYPVCPEETGILITQILVWVSAVITVISGIDYLRKNMSVFKDT